MRTLADGVCLAQPRGEFIVEFLGSDDSEAVHEQTLRVWARSLDARVDDLTLKVEVPGQRCLSGGHAGEPPPASFERDRGLRDGVAERTARLGKPDEFVVEADDAPRFATQMTLDGPFLRHPARLSSWIARFTSSSTSFANSLSVGSFSSRSRHSHFIAARP